MRKILLLFFALLLLPALTSAAVYEFPIKDTSFSDSESKWTKSSTSIASAVGRTDSNSLYATGAGGTAYQEIPWTTSGGALTTSAWGKGIDGAWTITYTFKSSSGATLHTVSHRVTVGTAGEWVQTAKTHTIPNLNGVTSVRITLTSIEGTKNRFIDDITATFSPSPYVITAKSSTGATLQTFSVNYTGTTYSTTSGRLELPRTLSKQEYIEVSAPSHFSKTVLLTTAGEVQVQLEWIDPATFAEYQFSAKDATTGATLQSFKADLYSGENHYSKSTTTGTLTFSAIPHTTEREHAQISADGYFPCLLSPQPATTAYLLSNASDAVLVRFAKIDYSNLFDAQNTRLHVKKPTANGQITISDSYFDAAGLCPIWLTASESYLLEITDGASTKGLGSYVATTDETVSLVVGSIPLLPTSEALGGLSCEITKTNTSAQITWIAPNDALLSPLSISISDEEGTEVYSLNSATPQGQATYQFPDQRQYKISITAETTGGKYEHSEYISQGENLIDLQVSEIWYAMISVFLIFLIALLFGYRHASAGALIVALLTIALSAIGFLNLHPLILALIAVLGILAVLRGRGA